MVIVYTKSCVTKWTAIVQVDVLQTLKLLYVKSVAMDFTISHVVEFVDIVWMGNFVYKILDIVLMDAATTFCILFAKNVKTDTTATYVDLYVDNA